VIAADAIKAIEARVLALPPSEDEKAA